jgi:hypothetical protein
MSHAELMTLPNQMTLTLLNLMRERALECFLCYSHQLQSMKTMAKMKSKMKAWVDQSRVLSLSLVLNQFLVLILNCYHEQLKRAEHC